MSIKQDNITKRIWQFIFIMLSILIDNTESQFHDLEKS